MIFHITQSPYVMNFKGQTIYPDFSIFHLKISCAPKYTNPTFNNAYIKILDLVDKSNEMTLKDCCNKLFGGSNFDTFKTLVVYHFLECVNPEAKRFRRYRLTDNGRSLLKDAEFSRPFFDFLDFIKSSNSNFLEELILNCTLNGENHFLENSFKDQIKRIVFSRKCLLNMFNRQPQFVRDFIMN